MIVVALGGLIAIGCLIGAFTWLRRKRLIDDLPTSKARGVFIGLAELKGSAESESPFTSYLAGVRCVQYSWQVEEQWSRMVTETYRDAQGRTQTRMRRETGWTAVGRGSEAAPFYLKDDTGVIRVVPDGAVIKGNTTINDTCDRDNALYFAKGPPGEIANSDHRRRFHETAIQLHATLYVVGRARERQDVVAAEIARDKGAPVFLISTQSEKQISTGYLGWMSLWLALGSAAAVGGALVHRLLQPEGMGSVAQPIALAMSLYAAAIGLGWIWAVYNSLVELCQRVRQAWSQVDVQLKRRNDLIPNLALVVEGYAAHERETQELVTRLRGQLAATPPGVAGPDFSGLGSAVRVTVERYPELKASESFSKLQEALSDTEQRIALARDYFNGIATFYNIRLSIIPDRFVAAFARLRPQALMGATEFERADVPVRLVS